MRFGSISLLVVALLAPSPAVQASGPPEEELPAVGDEPAPPAEPEQGAGPGPTHRAASVEPPVEAPKPAAAKTKTAPTKRKSSKANTTTGTKKKTSAKKNKPSKQGSAKKKRKNSPECAYRTPVHSHEVAEGEHLGLIAGRYGVLRKDLVVLNPELRNPDLIRPGQKIKVCPEIAPRESSQITYIVKAGDNVHSIAKAHGLSSKELLDSQDPPIANPDRILAGQELKIAKQGAILSGFEPEVHRKYDKGKLKTSHRLPKGLGYKIKRPFLAYGTASTIKLISKAIDAYHRRANGGPAVRVGDISKRGGGKLKGHVSHQRGVDVDVGLVHKGAKKDELRFFAANKKNLDVRRTWLLLHAFLRTEQVRYIFLDYRLQKLLYQYAKKHGVSESKLDEYFQYPRGIGRNHGIIRHWKGHRDHIHVRFRR
jgi:LysM repeat protein